MSLVYEPVPLPCPGRPVGGRHGALIAEFIAGSGPSARVDVDEPVLRLYNSLSQTVYRRGLRSQVRVAKRGDVVYLVRRVEGEWF